LQQHLSDFDAGRLAGLLRENSTVHDAAVMVDPGSGLISAFIVPQGIRPAAELRQRAMRIVGDVADRIQIVILHSIPRGQDGRLDEQRAMAAMQRSGAVHRYEPAATDMERAVVELVNEVLPGRQVSVTDSIGALGGDSLATLELTGLIRERLGIDIPAHDVFSGESLRDLAAALHELYYCDRAGGDGST
jgi:acyl carrier protein